MLFLAPPSVLGNAIFQPELKGAVKERRRVEHTQKINRDWLQSGLKVPVRQGYKVPCLAFGCCAVLMTSKFRLPIISEVRMLFKPSDYHLSYKESSFKHCKPRELAY